MIVWGGCPNPSCTQTLNTGGRYDPATDTWTAISTDGAPSARSRHTAVWAGTEMLVWGEGGIPAYPTCGFSGTGGRYNPASDRWVVFGGSEELSGSTAIWTDEEMLVWGGYDYDSRCKDMLCYCEPGVSQSIGRRYNPAID